MIVSPSNTIPYHINHGVFSIINGRYCTELENVIQYARSQGYIIPTDYQLKCIDTFIQELKNAGIWQLKDLLYIPGFNSRYTRHTPTPSTSSEVYTNHQYITDFALINYKDPTVFKGIRVSDTTGTPNPNDPELTPYGFNREETASSNQYIRTGYVFGTDNINWTQSSAALTLYLSEYKNVAGSTADFIRTNSSGSNRRIIQLRIQSSAIRYRINSTNVDGNDIANDGTRVGFYSLETISGTTYVYKNGSLVTSRSVTNQTLIGGCEMMILGTVTNGSYVGEPQSGNACPYLSIGASLGATRQRLEYQIYESFRNKLFV
jgi:hypothetical protein